MGKLHGLGWCDDGPQAMEKWYRLAILQNEARSMINLAIAHEQGAGVALKPDVSVALYRSAAELGEPTAHSRLASLHLAGEFLESDAVWRAMPMKPGSGSERRRRAGMRRRGGG